LVFRIVTFASAAAIAAGCGSDGGGGGSDTASAKACRDVAAALANAAVRCGGPYQDNYDAFVSTAANGNCDNIVAVRDSSSLYGTCIPSLDTISCSDLQTGNVDASCKSQLEHL
jgi:hypothetical protein